MKRLAFAALVLAGACTGGAPRPPMSDGERLYRAKCTSCHAAYEPSDYTAAQWNQNVEDMERLKKVHLSPEDRALILAYLSGSPPQVK